MQRPLRPSEAAKLLGLKEDGDEISCLNKAVGAMFPLRNEHYMAFHKSVVDYLVKKKTNESDTYINPLDGHKLFGSELAKQIDKTKDCDGKTGKLDWTFPQSGSYAVAHLFDHLYLTGDVDDKIKARDWIFELPWLMRIIMERGVASLLADFRKLLLADGEVTADRQLKLLHDGIYLAISDLQDTTGMHSEWLPLQIIGRIRPLVTNVELPLLGTLVDECEEWCRRYQPIFPSTFYLPSPGGALQTTLHLDSDVQSVAVLSDGRVVSGSDKTVRVWDLSTGECVQVLKGHTCEVKCVAVLSDGRVASGSNDTTIRVWDVSTGDCARVLKGHTKFVSCVAALSDGRVVSGSNDTTLRVWDLSTEERPRVLEGHTGWVTSVTVQSDGRVVSGSKDNTYCVWNLLTGGFVVTNVRLLDLCPLSILPALKSFGLPHVSACCEIPKSSRLAVGMKTGEMCFFTLLVSMQELQNS